MEKIETPKYCSFYWCHKRPFAICVGVRAEWNSDKVRCEESERGSGCPGEPFLCCDRLTDNTILPKLLDVTEGLNYLHANYTIHGDLKGAGKFSASFQAALTTSG